MGGCGGSRGRESDAVHSRASSKRDHSVTFRTSLVALIAGLLLAPNHDAGARKFQMSGTWVYRTGQVFIPLQFTTATMEMTGGGIIHLPMGVTANAFPNGPIPGGGGVTATGSAPATLRIPRHRFVVDAMAAVPLSGVTLVQITTNFGVDAPYAAATLAQGGGPGNFTWCPSDPACLAGGGMFSTDPPPHGSVGSRPGRVLYVAGPNQFGGTMQMGLKRGGFTAARNFSGVPFRVAYLKSGGPDGDLRSLPVGAGSADHPATEMVFLKRAFVTQPTMVPAPFHLILYPGFKLTTMFGFTCDYMCGPIYYLPTVAIGPMGTKAGQVTTHYGFGQTTGTVFVQQFTGYEAFTFLTFMGSDQRTPLGA